MICSRRRTNQLWKRVNASISESGANRSAFHGRDEFHVSGRRLPTGFHWDVRPGRAGTRIHTPIETWYVRVYVNVYPDATLRGARPYAWREQ